MEAKVKELKDELLRLTMANVEDDDYDNTCEVLRVLSSLKELKSQKSVSFKVNDNEVVPEKFKCPKSKEIMSDPVVLANGQTYERAFIQRWLDEGHRTCPQTQQVLSHTVLTPNHLVQEIISLWCQEHNIMLRKPFQSVDGVEITDADQKCLNSLLEKMSSSLPDQKTAAKELRRLTKSISSFRALFGETKDAISKLLSPLSVEKVDFDPDLQEDLITTVLNISIHENNKQLVAEKPIVLPLLIASLKSGTSETKANAAATLFTLSAIDTNRVVIGNLGALRPLIQLLDEAHPLAMKDVAQAIFNLCLVLENKEKAINGGAIKTMLKKIVDGVLVDELLAVLALLSSHQKAVEELAELEAVPCLLKIIKESTNERNKENCVVILNAICFTEQTKLKVLEFLEDDDAHDTLTKLAESGTARAKRKAKGIIDRVNRVASWFPYTP